MKYLLLLNYITLAFLGILSILVALKFKKNELPWKIIAIYLIGSFITQSIAYIYWELNWNNLKILHIYSLFQFVAFSAFYLSTTHGRIKKRVIWITSGVICCLLIINSIWNESLQEFNSLGVFISNGTIIIYVVAHFFEVLGADLHTKKYLIINSGILLFISESLVIFLFGNLLKDVEMIDQAGLWYTHAITYLLFLILTLWNHVKLNK